MTEFLGNLMVLAYLANRLHQFNGGWLDALMSLNMAEQAALVFILGWMAARLLQGLKKLVKVVNR